MISWKLKTSFILYAEVTNFCLQENPAMVFNNSIPDEQEDSLMPDNNELIDMLRAVIREEMQSVRQEVRAVVQEELKPVRQELQQVNTCLDTLEAGQAELRNDVQELRAGQQELKKGQASIEAALNDLRTINRRTHKEVFSQLNAIWDDIKLLSSNKDTRLNERRL